MLLTCICNTLWEYEITGVVSILQEQTRAESSDGISDIGLATSERNYRFIQRAVHVVFIYLCFI